MNETTALDLRQDRPENKNRKNKKPLGLNNTMCQKKIIQCVRLFSFPMAGRDSLTSAPLVSSRIELGLQNRVGLIHWDGKPQRN